MSVDKVARRHYRAQQSLARRTAEQIARLWREVDRAQIARSWRSLAAQAAVILTGAQAFAAASAEGYVDDVVGDDGTGRLRPQAFAGVASDGRDLAMLLYQPAIQTLSAIQSGSDVRRAMTTGLLGLDMIVRTQVADAGRVADGVAITTRPQVKGYVRMLVGNSCSRCAILAGRTYRWNQGFARHPRCDCRHIPAVEDAEDLRTDPRRYFDSLSAAEQDRIFTVAGAQAIRDGADVAKVVNARRGMYTAAGRRFTTEATTGRRRRVGARLMPEQIYLEAKGERGEAIRLLRLHGFVV